MPIIIPYDPSIVKSQNRIEDKNFQEYYFWREELFTQKADFLENHFMLVFYEKYKYHLWLPFSYVVCYSDREINLLFSIKRGKKGNFTEIQRKCITYTSFFALQLIHFQLGKLLLRAVLHF